jgi:AhpD family alkylhydroperoxidase
MESGSLLQAETLAVKLALAYAKQQCPASMSNSFMPDRYGSKIIMESRINFREQGQDALTALYGLGKYLSRSTVEKSLLELVYFRVSQINQCAFCLDMHSKDLRAAGETEQRLYLLSAWRESPFYTDKEQAALAWAEALTQLKTGLVADAVYNEALQHFTEAELIELTMAVIAINSYNRLNIAFGAPVGTYVVGQFA